MDEILSSWTTSLNSSVSSFSKLSGEILVWDGLLRRSGSEISLLLQGLARAEENQAKVGQLLDYIEGQQTDLESLLDGYERQVDELRQVAMGVDGSGGNALNGGGGFGSGGPAAKKGLQGGELERERMYTLAESLDSQLSSLSSNLSSMIVEINSSLSHNNPHHTARSTGTSTELASLPGGGGAAGISADEGDPIQQILVILNAHLKSLRWIDGAVKALRTRIQALRRGQIE